MSEDLDNLSKTVISCNKCGLAKTRKNAVPGLGYHKSEIIFIGEAPGRNEDLKGEPFVGAAGKILSEALEYAGLTRDGVYITNVVKCRPPNNRQPTTREIESCNSYLLEELRLISPIIICILGNTAFGSLLNGNSITKNRGKIIKKNGQIFFMTVHPAAVIYNPQLRQVLKDDLKLLAETLDKIKKGISVENTQ
jgi:uracil-DNA glycosylase family 4